MHLADTIQDCFWEENISLLGGRGAFVYFLSPKFIKHNTGILK
jgi:hypothetical protein